METFQLSLFYDYRALIMNSHFFKKYDAIFSVLDLSELHYRKYDIGRMPYSRHAMFRALIVKHLEEIPSIPRLLEYLDANPLLTEMCGFTPGCLPDESQFYRFLQELPNRVVQKLHLAVNKKLIEQGIVTLTTLIVDSKPVKAATKDNNPKNPSRNTSNKHKQPRRNPQATLGYYTHYETIDGTVKREYFWGYRTHVIVSQEGIPLVEVTLPTSKTDAQVANILIRKLKKLYHFSKNAVFIADAAYDVRDLYELIITRLKCRAIIPINPRYSQPPKAVGPHGAPLCDAGLEMTSDGWWCDKNTDKAKFRCPLKTRSTIAKQYPDGCPVHHARFSEGAAYGCTKYLTITNDARARVPRSSTLFEELYNKRIICEQYFSRLGSREADQTTHYTLRVVKNQITIAHLAQSLVALAAVALGQLDKIRCVRTFAMTA